MRLLHGAGRRRAGEMLHHAGVEHRRKIRHHCRGPRQYQPPSPAATGFHRRAGRPMRLLPVGHPDHREGFARQKPEADARRDRAGARRQHLPLRLAQPHHARRRKSGGRDARGGLPMTAPLPAQLEANPELDRWVAFPAPGKVTVLTGRVELGQGVLTAMRQIAADELDVAMERITVRSGDTEKAPNEGYTAGSQSIQFGGVALRQALAEVRALFLNSAAKVLACKASELSVRDGGIYRNGKSTGQDYWTLAGAVDLAVKATGAVARKPVGDLKTIGANSARLDLPAKVFGQSVFIHDMQIDGMVHARVVRQPNRGATIGAIDENAIRRAAKGSVEFVRHGNFLAILGKVETAVEAAGAAAVNHVTWQNVEAPTATQQEANWLLQRPVVERVFGAPDAGNPQNRERYEATYTRGYLAHASISPSCGLALYQDGTLTVWTHC